MYADTDDNQAVASLCQLVIILPPNHVEQYYLPLLKRLSLGEWFTSRTSATGLYADAYHKVPANTQSELRRYNDENRRDFFFLKT